MWIANDWKEYEVIDTSCGEKLERWGKYTLVRPDPQVIWDTPKVSRGWKNMNAHYHRSKKAAVNGNSLTPSAVGSPLQRSYFPSETVQFQTHRTFPGAGCQLGLVW